MPNNISVIQQLSLFSHTMLCVYRLFPTNTAKLPKRTQTRLVILTAGLLPLHGTAPSTHVPALAPSSLPAPAFSRLHPVNKACKLLLYPSGMWRDHIDTHLRCIRRAWKRTQIILICYHGISVVGTTLGRRFLR